MNNQDDLLKFAEAVLATSDIANGYFIGLGALGANSKCVKVANTKSINGSVDIDQVTQSKYPNDARWDYVIGYNEKAYYLEIHPAQTSNVKEVIKKVDWLSNWLTTRATHLKRISCMNPFYWVPSGNCRILPNSQQYRQLIQKKIKIVKALNLK